MFSKLQIFASLLTATVASAAAIGKPIPTTSLPTFQLSASDLAFSPARIVSATNNLNPDSALVNPTLIVCTATGCASGCVSLQLVGASKNVCLAPNPPLSFVSVAINNPDNTVIPFAVQVGNCATSLAQIPQSNMCFNLSPAGVNFKVVAGSTP